MWMQSLDSLPKPYQETEPSPPELSEETAEDQVDQDRIPDTEVLSEANIPSIPTLLVKAQLRWTGHVTRMPCNRLPKQVFLASWKMAGEHKVGPQKRYKDTLKASLKSIGFDPESWEPLILNRPAWRRKVQGGAVLCESRRVSCAMLRAAAQICQEGTCGCTSL